MAWLLAACRAPDYDVVIRGGMVYDGSGQPGVRADVALNADTIAVVGDLSGRRGRVEIDATGQAIASGFINMLSWATESLLEDGHSQGDLRQGVTLEVMGEGWSMGPLNPVMKADMQRSQRDFKFDVAWTTLDQYLRHLEQRGITPNVASFVGATTVRIHELGYANRPPTPAELERMKALVRQAMEDGALGLGSSLIYAPAFYAATDELIALAQVVAEYDGLYISHMRSEGNRLEESVEELLRIAREANVRAEVYHLKAAGETNWPKMARVLDRIEQARTEGLRITADMYTYPAGATGLDAAMPPWVQEGGYEAWRERLRDPALRARVLREMRTPADDWENLMRAAGPEGTLFIGFRQDSLRRRYIGQTLAQVAAAWGRSPEETALDLVIADSSRVEVVYFLMSEDNIRQQIARPWVSFGSDAESMATDTAFTFLRQSAHPRAYGNFARLLARYVRDERVIPLEEAVRRLTALPAENLRIERRGRLQPGFFADVVVFDPATIQDHATFEQPHQYSTGVQHVWVNGVQVLRDGEHTGAKPGRVVRRAR
jgi:N-acyl-D-amino-acid deacylase